MGETGGRLQRECAEAVAIVAAQLARLIEWESVFLVQDGQIVRAARTPEAAEMIAACERDIAQIRAYHARELVALGLARE